MRTSHETVRAIRYNTDVLRIETVNKMKSQQLSAACVFLVTLAPALATAKPEPREAAGLPNVIIIFSDDHGYTDLGIHGIDSHVDTPNMDALARGGALMKAGYSSAPQCRPSRCGLMTGRIQNEFGFSDNKCDAGAGEGTLPRAYPSGTDMAGQPLLTIADRMMKIRASDLNLSEKGLIPRFSRLFIISILVNGTKPEVLTNFGPLFHKFEKIIQKNLYKVILVSIPNFS